MHILWTIPLILCAAYAVTMASYVHEGIKEARAALLWQKEQIAKYWPYISIVLGIGAIWLDNL